MPTNIIIRWMHMTVRLRKLKTAFSAGNDLHMNELFALGRIYHAVHTSKGSISNAEIQEELQVTKSAVSQMLDSLAEKGYIDRKPDANDRRRMSVTITAEGEQILWRMRQQVGRLTEEVVKRMGEEKIAQMFDLFNEFIDVFVDVQKEMEGGSPAEASEPWPACGDGPKEQ